jgi:hypothetical protein
MTTHGRDENWAFKIVVGKPEWRNDLGELGVYGTIILKWTLKQIGLGT